MVLLIALLLQADPSEEIAGLVRSLTSDAPEERDLAVRRLKEIGAPARPALEEALKRGDADLKARARDLLDHFVRAERVGALRGSPDRRVSAELRDVSLEEAFRATLHPFGLTRTSVKDPPAAKKISLSLKDAPFWEALERLEAAAGARMNLESGRMEPGDAGPRAGAGAARVTHASWGSHSRGGGPSKAALFVRTWLPPGAWACSAAVSDVELTSEAGKPIEGDWVSGLDSVRRPGLPSGIGVGCLTVHRTALKGVQSVTLRATLRLGVPRDVERTAMERIPGKVGILGGDVTLDKLTRRDPDGWDISLGGRGGGSAFTVLLSVEDGAGAWLGDLHTLALHPSGSIGVSTSSFSLRKGAPARCIVLRAIGEEEIKVPFTLTSIAVPPYARGE